MDVTALVTAEPLILGEFLQEDQGPLSNFIVSFKIKSNEINLKHTFRSHNPLSRRQPTWNSLSHWKREN